MPSPRSIPVAERRARLGVRHALAAPVATPEAATAAVVALHSSDPVSVHLAARARTGAAGRADVERALYDEGTLVRLHGMRRTLWVVTAELEPAVRVAAGAPLAGPARTTLLDAVVARGAVADPEAWIAGVADALVAVLEERGETSATELAAAVPELSEKVLVGAGTRWATEVTVASRLLTLLGFEGRVVRARPVGSWVSGQYRYVAGTSRDRGPDPDPATARAAVVGAVLARFGPVTIADLRWWTGWTAAAVRAAVAAVAAVEVTVDGETALVAADDVAPVAAPDPWVALLPGLDPTTMGWKARGWYLGDLGPELFDRNGNAGPTVWADGRVVGGWAQRPDATIAVDLRTDVGAEARDAIEAQAHALEAWMGGLAVTPRARRRSPVERALAEGAAPVEVP